MSFEFRPAKRENVPLLVGLAGGTGSGKTMSAMRLAAGMSGGKPFAVVDTENGRALHYADQFKFDHAELHEPFRPERYAEAIQAASESYDVVVVDSFSHEYSGDGGLLDWHETELQRMAGEDWKRREAMTFAAWVKPKMAHKRLVSQLLQLRAHLIVCLRAEEKIAITKGADGKTKVEPKRTLAGHVGWIPITEKSFPFELTTSLVLTPDAPGIPKPIKLQEQHRAFVPLDKPITEETGRLLADWARGGAEAPAAKTKTQAPEGEQASFETDVSFTTTENGGEETPAAMDVDFFRKLCADRFVSPQQVGATGKKMFPGRSMAELSDEERGQLWQALETTATAVTA